MLYYNFMPPCNRKTRREVERYMKKHPKLTFTQAYNKLFHTDYCEPPTADTSEEQPWDVSCESSENGIGLNEIRRTNR